MQPQEVNEAWPLAWEAAANALARDRHHPIAAVKAARLAEGLELSEAKRVLIALQENHSHEDHEEHLIESLGEAFRLLDEEEAGSDL